MKVMIPTFYGKRDYLDQALINGADGYLLKREMDQELRAAIQAIRRGEVY